MTFAIIWHPAARHILLELPIRTATLVDRAVIRFAELGEGQVEWVAPYHRLRAGPYDVALSVDGEACVINGLDVYRARP